MLENLLGYLSVFLILTSAIVAWRIYDLTKSRALAWLLGTFIYTVIVRLVIVYWEPMPLLCRNLVLLPFYIGLTVGMIFLYIILKKYIHRPHGGLWMRFKKRIGLK